MVLYYPTGLGCRTLPRISSVTVRDGSVSITDLEQLVTRAALLLDATSARMPPTWETIRPHVTVVQSEHADLHATGWQTSDQTAPSQELMHLAYAEASLM
jgi:hypothetical protein